MRWPRALALVAVVALAGGCGEHERAERPRPFAPVAEPEAAGARAPAAPRFATGRILRRVHLRSRPGGRIVGRAGPRTEFGSRRVVAIVRRRGGWLGVHAPERPNGRLAWLPARAVREGGTDVWVRIDRSERRLEVRRRGRVLRTVTVAVGKPGHETPLGRYAVTDHLRARAGSPYGCCAIALTGHQTKLVPGWPGGDRLAIHGTRQRDSIGRAASLGCLRARDRDLRTLMRALPLGAPVVVVA